MLLSTFVLIMGAIISLTIDRFLPRISSNYISLLIGIIWGLVPVLNAGVERFDTHIFMILAVAPLLFFEGQATPINLVRQKLGKVIGITVTMVLICTLAASFSVSLIPGMTLPLAFVMAAISTPTDATAAASVSEGLKMPKKEGVYLKLESLFNDASGLILLQATALWFVRGRLNYGSTLLNFLYSTLGGIVVGLLLSFVFVIIRQLLIKYTTKAVTVQTLIYLICPFLIYIIAEEAHVSGIIAVVCAGLVHNSEARSSHFSDAHQHYVGTACQQILTNVLNSVVFVILGLMFVRICRNNLTWGNITVWGVCGIFLYLANIIVRYAYARLRLHSSKRNALVFSLGGVHGAVTIALVFNIVSYPFGHDFFNLVLMAEAVLVILSMVVPTIVFRFILPHKESEEEALQTMHEIRKEMVAKAIRIVNGMSLDPVVRRVVILDLNDQTSDHSLRLFFIRWFAVSTSKPLTEQQQDERRKALYICFSFERRYVRKMVLADRIDSDHGYEIYHDILLAEALLANPYSE